MKSKLLLFTFFILSTSGFSQKQANHWFFGQLAGMDFSSGSPVAVTNGAVSATEGTASISDSLGNLLFYTDGINVYNRNNVAMPNGTGLLGDVSTTQTLIVPKPGSHNLFYIFTLDDEGGTDGLNYSIVDMTLQGGNGDVTNKNVHLRDNMTEKVAGVYHCNGHDIWIMTHDWLTNSFASYLLTDSGLIAPVISNVGITHTDVHGQMKFASDGSKIAVAVGYTDTVQVLSFDNKTGKVSNPLSIALHHHVYGLEFSPDNSKLYVTHYDIGGESNLVQIDLTISSKPVTKIYSSPDPILYALQLGPDKKIYVTKEITSFVSVVNSPNATGLACNYVDNVVNLDPNSLGVMCLLGLPGFVASYFNADFPNFPPCDTTTTQPPDTTTQPPDTTSEIKCGEIFVPTAFSPNNDQHNDAECVYGKCIASMHFAIFDLWGEKVFETTDRHTCWDGKYKGKLMNSATFVYYLDAVLTNGEAVFKKGNINLIR